MKRLGQAHGRVGRGQFGLGQDDAQTQAGRAAAVAHRLAHVDVFDMADRPVGGGEALRHRMTVRVVARFGRADQGQAVLPRNPDQHGVEQIGADGVGQRQVGGRDLDELRLETDGGGADGGLGRVRVLERQLMEEEGVQGADADHVVVEGAPRDGGLALTRQDGAGRAMAAHDGFRRLARLAGGVGAVPMLPGLAAPHHQIDARLAVIAAQADVVGGAFVRQMGDRGQSVVDGEAAGVGEEGVQRALGLIVLKAAVQVGDQIGGGEVDAAVMGVGAGRHRGGVGGPHGRGRTGGGGEGGGFLPCAFQHLGVGAREAEVAQEGDVRPLMRGQDELGQTQVGQGLHLVEALQHRRARVRRLALIQAGGEVAGRQTCVGVRRPDQAVGVGFDGGHASFSPCGRRWAPEALG